MTQYGYDALGRLTLVTHPCRIIAVGFTRARGQRAADTATQPVIGKGGSVAIAVGRTCAIAQLVVGIGRYELGYAAIGRFGSEASVLVP